MMEIKYIDKGLIACIAILLIVLSFVSCNVHKYNDVLLSEALDNTLSEYIERYASDSIVRVEFSKAENHVDMLIFHEPYYDKNYLDGCFEKEGKLIVYHSDYEGLMDSLISPYYSVNEHILEHYKPWVLSDYDGERDIREYCILSKNYIVADSQIDHKYQHTTTDTVGVHSPSLNKIINETLNSSGVLVVSLHFSSINNEDYLCVNKGGFYDCKNVDGCIIRNGRLVTFHIMNEINCDDLFDVDYVKRNIQMTSKYKMIPEDDRSIFIAFGDCYKIVTPDSLLKVDSTEYLTFSICK